MLDVMRTLPAAGKYAYMKAQILRRYGVTSQKRLQTFFIGLELGTRKPSQLLKHMRSLIGSSVGDEVLWVRWLDLMPDNVAKMLRNSLVEELAEVAANIVNKHQPSHLQRGRRLQKDVFTSTDRRSARCDRYADAIASFQPSAGCQVSGHPRLPG